MKKADYEELKRLDGMGMVRVRCDSTGQRGATDNMGHVELVTEGTLMDVTPYTPALLIKDALRAGSGETNA